MQQRIFGVKCLTRDCGCNSLLFSFFPCAPGGFYLYNIWAERRGGVGGDAHISFAGGRKGWKCIFLINGPPLPSPPLSLLVLSLMNSNVVHFAVNSLCAF